MNAVCYCEGYCPNNEPNGTCVLKAGAQCFSSVEEVYNLETKTYEPLRRFGCLPPDEQSVMQCKGDIVPHHFPKSIKCCNFTDLCNKNLIPEYRPVEHNVPSTFFFLKSVHFLFVLTLFSIILAACFMLITFYYLRNKKKKGSRLFLPIPCKTLSTLNEVITMSSGSGPGSAILTNRTVAHDLDRIMLLGEGACFQIWLASYNGERIAVKKFALPEEERWHHEANVYKTIRHQNILGFIATDIYAGIYETEFLIMVDYHENGSLYNFLQTNKLLNAATVLKLAQSAIAAVSYLHNEAVVASDGKPAIAHRNINSKNFLINSNNECVLSDFTMAVSYCSTTRILDLGTTLKTRSPRYMAPEVLDGSIDTRAIIGFQRTDIYSLALVFWEMCRKCGISDGTRLVCDDHVLPFHDKVPERPTLDEMRKIVVDQQERPFIPTQWENGNQVLKSLVKIMRECWHHEPASRLPALRIKKSLTKIMTHPEIV